MERLSSWLVFNYLQVNGDKIQAMILGNSSYRYDLEFAGTPLTLEDHLKILGPCLDNKLSFKEHINVMLKKVHAKIAALRRLRRLALQILCFFIGVSYYHILSTATLYL